MGHTGDVVLWKNWKRRDFATGGQTNEFLQFKLANVLKSWFSKYQIV